MKLVLAMAMLAALGLCGCASDAGGPAEEFLPADIVGNWFWQLGETDIVISLDPAAAAGRYEGTVVTETGCFCCGGQLILEFEWSDAEGAFTGRHLWGGCQHDETYWGEEGFLRISPIDRDRIIVRYLDGVDQGGWNWYRLD